MYFPFLFWLLGTYYFLTNSGTLISMKKETKEKQDFVAFVKPGSRFLQSGRGCCIIITKSRLESSTKYILLIAESHGDANLATRS